jgi:Flp pilus assembly protein TadD
MIGECDAVTSIAVLVTAIARQKSLPHYGRSLGYLKGREFEMAADLCRDALAEEPRDDKIRVLLGTVLVRQNRFEEAEHELRDVISRFPTSPRPTANSATR